jgi:hypothetical protein
MIRYGSLIAAIRADAVSSVKSHPHRRPDDISHDWTATRQRRDKTIRSASFMNDRSM